jgi:hypothetical protein
MVADRDKINSLNATPEAKNAPPGV